MKIKSIKRPKIFIICISITFFIMICKKLKFEDIINLRSLYDQKNINYVCGKAGKSLAKKYSNGYDEEIYEIKNINKEQKAIIDLFRYSKYKYTKNYLPRIAVFIVFLILDILFIFFWISYCFCCCCDCCLFKTAIPQSFKKRIIFFLISSTLNIFVIIFSILVLLFINPFLKKLNGIACSTFTLVDHFLDGTKGSYPQISNKWDGIQGVQKILNNTSNIYNDIIYDEELYKNIEYTKSNYSYLSEDTCGIRKIIENDSFEKDIYDFYQLTNSSFNTFNYDEDIQNLNEAYDEFNRIENNTCQDVYNIFHDYINKYVKKVLIIFFSITLFFGLMGFIFLILYYCSKRNSFRIVYVIIWNISMLLMILSILISVIFGLIGFISEDSLRVIQYIFSKDNLDSADPLFFNSNSFLSNFIYNCVNGEGDFLSVILKNEELEKNIKNINQNSDKYKNIINQLNQFKCNEKEEIAKKSIINVYDLLLKKNTQLVEISSTLNNINCIFAKNDEMIILGEISSTSKNGIIISGFSFLVGIIFGLSIFAGILFVHKYKYKYENSLTDKYVIKANESDTNINNSNI